MEKSEALERIARNGAELKQRMRLEEPRAPGEAELAGPWEVVPGGGRWAVRSVYDGEVYARNLPWETAALVAASLPATGRAPIYDLSLRRRHSKLMTADDRGFVAIGQCWMAGDREKILKPLHTAHCLAISPDSLAWLLLAAERKTLERAATVVSWRLERYRPGPARSAGKTRRRSDKMAKENLDREKARIGISLAAIAVAMLEPPELATWVMRRMSDLDVIDDLQESEPGQFQPRAFGEEMLKAYLAATR